MISLAYLWSTHVPFFISQICGKYVHIQDNKGLTLDVYGDHIVFATSFLQTPKHRVEVLFEWRVIFGRMCEVYFITMFYKVDKGLPYY